MLVTWTRNPHSVTDIAFVWMLMMKTPTNIKFSSTLVLSANYCTNIFVGVKVVFRTSFANVPIGIKDLSFNGPLQIELKDLCGKVRVQNASKICRSCKISCTKNFLHENPNRIFRKNFKNSEPWKKYRLYPQQFRILQNRQKLISEWPKLLSLWIIQWFQKI